MLSCSACRSEEGSKMQKDGSRPNAQAYSSAYRNACVVLYAGRGGGEHGGGGSGEIQSLFKACTEKQKPLTLLTSAGTGRPTGFVTSFGPTVRFGRMCGGIFTCSIGC